MKPSSERTADADVEMLRASITFMQGAFTRDKCYAALDRLVARNQQLQEALAETEARLELALSLMNRDIEAMYEDGLDAALASVRARTPARDGAAT